MRALVAGVVLVGLCAGPALGAGPQQERCRLHAQAVQLRVAAWRQWWEVGRMVRELGGLSQAMERAGARVRALGARIRALQARLGVLEARRRGLELALAEARAQAGRRLRALYLRGLRLEQVVVARAEAGELLAVGYSLRLMLEADRRRLGELAGTAARLRELKDQLRGRYRELCAAVEEMWRQMRQLQAMASSRRRLLVRMGRRIARLVEAVAALARAENRLVRTFGLGPAAGLGMAAAVVPGGVVVGRSGKGVVVAAAEGEGVMSPWEGVVSFAGVVPGWAKVVVVDHQGRVHTVVGGLQRVVVSEGQKVGAGDVLGMVGASGRVYLELRVGTRALEADRWLGLGG